ncbi:MAG: Rod shape-determining protein MreD [Cyclobacteriaceae bacterium]
MTRNLTSHIVRYLLLLALQVLVFRDLILYDTAFNFIYIIGLILLPIEIGPLVLIAVGFFSGLIVDMFYNTQGIQASAAVFIMFIRPYFFRFTTRGSYDTGTELNIREMGFNWFLAFCFPLIFLHCLTVFYVEFGSFNLFFFTLSKAFFSAIYTFVTALILQYLFTKPRRRT